MVLGHAPDLRRMRCPANTRARGCRRAAFPTFSSRISANFTFAMTAAPAQAESWKAQLLRGETDDRYRGDCCKDAGHVDPRKLAIRGAGRAVSPIYRSSRSLRLDPYYRQLAKISPDLAPHFNKLIENCRTRRVSLVHGDWSPEEYPVLQRPCDGDRFRGDPLRRSFLRCGLPAESSAIENISRHRGSAASSHRIFWERLQAGDAACAVV